MEVKRTSAFVCSSVLYRKFKSLNYQKRGQMRPTLMGLRKSKDFNVIYYVEEEVRVIGWSLSLYECYIDRSLKILTTHIYTRQKSRGLGVAAQIFESLKEFCKETNHSIAFHPWDERSNIYFTRCMKKSNDIKIELRYYAQPREIREWKAYEGL